MTTLGIIPARGGSKGVARKNVRMLAGKPLLAWAAEAAIASSLDRVILSSEDQEIIEVARHYSVEIPFRRPQELAEDHTPAIDVVLHALKALFEIEGYRPDAVMLLQPTSPLRTTLHINQALDLFEQHPEATSLVSVVRVPHNMTPESIMFLGEDGYLGSVSPWDERKNLRHLKPAYFARNGAAIYLTRTECILEEQSLYGNKILAYPMLREESIDIDELFDFEICEFLLSRKSSITGSS